jgi:hypothetical protein
VYLHRTPQQALDEVQHVARRCAWSNAQLHPPGMPPPAGPSYDIPNKHVLLLNNLVLNPPGYQSQWQHLEVRGPIDQSWPGKPAGAAGDEGLIIWGNVIWNGPSDHPLGVGGDSCMPSNPTCNEAQLLAQNSFNRVEPRLVDPARGDFRPVAGGSLAGALVAGLVVAPLPSFASWAVPVCGGNLSNVVGYDRDGRPRLGGAPPGAYTFGTGEHCAAWHLLQETPGWLQTPGARDTGCGSAVVCCMVSYVMYAATCCTIA